MNQETINSVINMASSIDWNSWITTASTVILAVLTFVYVRLTRKILDSQSDPCVIISIIHDNDYMNMLQLVVKNIGNGGAHDVRFEFSRPIPERAFDTNPNTDENEKPITLMTSGFLFEGIPFLGPGECRRIAWGQYRGLISALGEKPVTATVRFKKNGREMKPAICQLAVKSFLGTDAMESSVSKLAKEIEKLGQIMKKQ